MTGPDNTRQAAEEIQAVTTQTWAGDLARNRCTSTRTVSTPEGDLPVRCEGAAGHGGTRHLGQLNGARFTWSF
ncbi:MAG TPA: hypothetical protein VKB69_05225 [Micromonosporaceae bacterium]|nr:hypothetical protein [Micromonosporaceae bacterium]